MLAYHFRLLLTFNQNSKMKIYVNNKFYRGTRKPFSSVTFGKILFAVLVSFTVNVSSQSKVWTLEECIAYAFENNIQIQQNRINQKIAEQDLKGSKYNLLPDLNGFASHTYNFGQTIDPFTNQFANTQVRSNSFSLSSNVTIFNGFRNINTIKRNQALTEAAKLDLEKMQNDIALNISNLYLSILFNKELLKNAQSQLRVTAKQVDRIKKQVNAGALAEGANKDIEAQFASEELQLINAQNQLQLSKLNLAQLLRLESSKDFDVVSPNLENFGEVKELVSPEALYLTALGIMPEVKSSEYGLYNAEKNTQIARSAYYPTLSVNGSIGTGFSGANREVVGATVFEDVPTGARTLLTNDLVVEDLVIPTFSEKSFSDQFDENENKSIGFRLTIPIFNRLSARTNVQRAKLQAQNAELQYENTKLALRQSIESAHNDAVAALKRYKAAEKSVSALETSFAYTQERFNVGIINSFDFNNEKNRLNNAQSELLQAKYNYIFSTKVLDFYQGKAFSFK